MIYLATAIGGPTHGGNAGTIGFCSYCARLGAPDRQRVCPDCGLGMLLHTDSRALRSPGAAFLIVHADGRVSVASAAAERVLEGAGELVGRPLLGLLAPCPGEGDLAHAVVLAAGGAGSVERLRVERLQGPRTAGELHAVVAPCGDPAAALVVLETAASGARNP